MNRGALPTESVAQLFKTVGLAERYERLKKGESAETLLAEPKQPRPPVSSIKEPENNLGPCLPVKRRHDSIISQDTMKALTEYVAKSLVDHPEEVVVKEVRHGSRVTLELSVAKDDMGRVIGKGDG